ncbi:hypothetical protein E2C01_057981 [Portunus trituberculatus]|uniref:Uncharacterized protein n=1 Tax=Portunus trituberculatus TaxID=210409 RepID=A0A5B7H1F7_PORTR|nr:hypothetical protein [Portunus trituberculatus]
MTAVPESLSKAAPSFFLLTTAQSHLRHVPSCSSSSSGNFTLLYLLLSPLPPILPRLLIPRYTSLHLRRRPKLASHLPRATQRF